MKQLCEKGLVTDNPFGVLSAILLAMLMNGCAVPGPTQRPDTYDFGLPPATLADSQSAIKPVNSKLILAVADVQAPRRLESLYLYYRLAYTDVQASKPYANSRWAMPPPQLITSRLKDRLAQDANVLSSNDVAADMSLRLELETFDQIFDTPASSKGVVRLRASLLHDRKLVAQQLFSSEQPAKTADAVGGVHALTLATDTVLNEVAAWVNANKTQ